jgi:hypothetical protein
MAVDEAGFPLKNNAAGDRAVLNTRAETGPMQALVLDEVHKLDG